MYGGHLCEAEAPIEPTAGESCSPFFAALSKFLSPLKGEMSTKLTEGFISSR